MFKLLHAFCMPTMSMFHVLLMMPPFSFFLILETPALSLFLCSNSHYISFFFHVAITGVQVMTINRKLWSLAEFESSVFYPQGKEALMGVTVENINRPWCWGVGAYVVNMKVIQSSCFYEICSFPFGCGCVCAQRVYPLFIFSLSLSTRLLPHTKRLSF